MKENKNQDFNVSEKLVPYSIPTKYKRSKTLHPNIMFIAECPGETEDIKGKPLVGVAGKKFDSWLEEVNIDRNEAIIANVFRYRPDNNKIEHFFKSELSAKNENIEISKEYLRYNHKYLIKHFEPEIQELYSCITQYKPKIVVPMGSVPLWATIRQNRITLACGIPVIYSFRTKDKSKEHSHTCTVIPTFHPASTLEFRDSNGEKNKASLEALKLVKQKIKEDS